MMGLHRLDDPNAEHEMAPTIAPPKDWTELEGEWWPVTPEHPRFNADSGIRREETSLLGCIYNRLPRVDQHGMANVDRYGRGWTSLETFNDL